MRRLHLGLSVAYSSSTSVGREEFGDWAQFSGAVSRFSALCEEAVLSDEQTSSVYGQVTRGDYCLLDVELTALPGPGQAATADPFAILAAGERDVLYKDFLLRPSSEWPSFSISSPAWPGTLPGHYPKIVNRLLASGMVVLLPLESPAIENSIFGVWKTKGVSQRFIWSGSRFNQLYREEAGYNELPNPDLFSTLIVPPDKNLYTASCDISQFYNRIKAPEFLIPFFGLPRIRAARLGITSTHEFLVPCLRWIPMGATFAVMLAQKVSLAVVRRSGFSRNIISSSSSKFVEGKSGRVAVYIDDITVLSTRRKVANRILVRIIQQFRRHGLPVEESKTSFADFTPSDALGIRWCPSGVLTPRPSTFAKLVSFSLTLISRRKGSPAMVRRLNGLWIWVALLRRGILSIMSAVFEFADQKPEGTSVKIPSIVLAELECLLGLLPLVYADLCAPFSLRAYASDASSTGAGVVYRDVSGYTGSFDVDQFIAGDPNPSPVPNFNLPNDSQPDQDQPGSLPCAGASGILSSSNPFKIAIQFKWGFSAHINLLEGEAVVLALRHMSRSPVSRGHRVHLFVDSQVVLGAFAKGRSSSSPLNRLCQKVALLCLENNVRLELYWIPSKLNPADHPSRNFGPTC